MLLPFETAELLNQGQHHIQSLHIQEICLRKSSRNALKIQGQVSRVSESRPHQVPWVRQIRDDLVGHTPVLIQEHTGAFLCYLGQSRFTPHVPIRRLSDGFQENRSLHG